MNDKTDFEGAPHGNAGLCGDDGGGGGNESRRTFLKIMGASIALAGLTSCRRWPAEELAPYAHRPPSRMDGVPVSYATATEIGGIGIGALAVSMDGRPIKIDGNPTHPLSQGGGASDMYLQASILGLYDPDRSRSPVLRRDVTGPRNEGRERIEKSWADFAAFAKSTIHPDGSGLVILTEASRSPSVAATRKLLPQAKWFEYEAISNDNQRAGAQQVFGRPLRAVPQLDKAEVIVSIDADLFNGDPMSTKYARDFAAGRKLHDSANASHATMNRLYVLESGFTTTGSMADHRHAVQPSFIAPIVKAILASLSSDTDNRSSRLSVPTPPEDMAAFSRTLMQDIAAHPGKAVFVVGQRLAPEIHAAIAAINFAINAPVDYYADPEDPRDEKTWTPHSEQLIAFAKAAQTADVVLILGANPVLTAPADLDLANILSKAKASIHAGLYEDETAQACMRGGGWHIPMAHYLEAWSDVRTFDGTVSIAQPLIEPIFGGKSTIEILSLLAGKERRGLEIVRETAKNDYLKGRYSEWSWKQSLSNGIVENSARKPESLPGVHALARHDATGVHASACHDAFQLTLITGSAYDGRFTNNGWLMELPDPMTRVCWDNPLLVSPQTAAKLGLQSDDVVRIRRTHDYQSRDRKGATHSPDALSHDRSQTVAALMENIDATIFIMPGYPNATFGLAVGYGRKTLGAIANNVGANAYALTSTADAQNHGIIYIDVQKYGDKVNRLACVQDHHVIDKVGRDRMHAIVSDLIIEGTLAQYQQHPALETRKTISLSMWNEHDYDAKDNNGDYLNHKWGLAIDLTACTGCSACVVACQSENNIPIVGKETVYRGREMHWLRIDRYFKWPKDANGNVDETSAPQALHQPLLCMHCENAPCEEVCPVLASTHSREGLNMMAYNRCVGTRYCSNNCPYKVRRFNFFDYNFGTLQNLYVPNILREDINELVKMSKNPQVTVRSRGVMEKCTYCIQRIEAARIAIRAKTRHSGEPSIWPDGTVVTACQQACPTGAIVFGDLHDKNSKVAKLCSLAQSYALLDPELNTKPRTRYLAKIRNPAEMTR